MRPTPAVLAALVLLAALVPPAPGVAAATLQVEVKNFAFVPKNASIAKGDTVLWHWVSGTHNVRENGTGLTWCSTRSSGDCTRTFPSAGAFAYYCSIHPSSMRGTVFVDLALPVVTITAPAEGATVWNRFAAAGNATHPSGIDRVEVRVGDGPAALAEGGAAWSAVVDSNPVPNGPALLRARAFSVAGPEAEAVLAVVVDNPPVALEVAQPAEGAVVGALVPAWGAARHPFHPIADARWRLDGGPWAELPMEPVGHGARWQGLLDLTAVPGGEHVLEFQARNGYAPQDSAIVARAVTLLNPLPLPAL